MAWAAATLSLAGETRRLSPPPPFRFQFCTERGKNDVVRPFCARATKGVHQSSLLVTLKHDTAVTHQRVKRKERVLAYLQLRRCSIMYSQMWFSANMGFFYTLGQLGADDTPTHQPKRDIFTFLSAQDCINLLRFNQPQVCVCCCLL